MTNIAIREHRPRALRTIGLGLAAGSLLVWSGLAQAASPPESFSGLAKKVSPAVVNIASSKAIGPSEFQAPELPFDFPEGSPFEKFFKQFRDRGGNGGGGTPETGQATALGSGFIIDPAGYVVTNNHVVDAAKNVTVRLDDESTYNAKIVGTDSLTDLALLKIDAKRALPAVEFGDSDKTEVGDWIMAVGNPFGLGGTVTAGIVSARGRNIASGPYDDFLQIDAPINQGNSGGPLFNLDGQVIGVNTAIYSPNGGSVGIGFAIPSNIAKSVIAQIRDHGKVERGWLGVQIQKITPEIASAVGLKEARGAMVTEVVTDSPAAKAGLTQGDVILGFDGQPVGEARELARLVAGLPAGTKAKISIWRARAETTLSVVTGRQPAQLAARQPQANESGTLHSNWLNADLATLTPERRAQFHIGENVTGVLVLDIKSGNMFEQGLRAGDVIKQVGQTAVAAPRDVESLLQQSRSAGSDAVLMLVSRQGQDLFLGLKLGTA